MGDVERAERWVGEFNLTEAQRAIVLPLAVQLARSLRLLVDYVCSQ